MDEELTAAMMDKYGNPTLIEQIGEALCEATDALRRKWQYTDGKAVKAYLAWKVGRS